MSRTTIALLLSAILAAGCSDNKQASTPTEFAPLPTGNPVGNAKGHTTSNGPDSNQGQFTISR